ncbi:DUF1501 domain-containing protein [Prosthecobacter sp.]|jgi:hypothetical protein|uniref:DUF1501 domain-containing protein n=1 Tax=Prosthecobacter sp. TaxID=1965333 RepID=UPI0037834C6D
MKRRHFLQNTSLGFGWLGLSALAAPQAVKSSKRVIFLCMRGAPSHVDTFDYKPKLNADSGKPGTRAGTQLLGSRWKFAQHGQSGQWMSELFPELAKSADDLCFLHGMQTDLPAHPQAYLKLHTGSSQFVRPSMGAWTLYGLGSLNENLPGFITITPASGFGGAQNYGSAFLPAQHQGTRIGAEKRPIANAEMANLRPKLDATSQRAELDLIQALNRGKLAREQHDPQVDGLIESYELAYKMQSEMPVFMDLNKESEATKKLYGIGDAVTDDFGRKCLLARRMVEAGVRFVEINHGDWDHHAGLGEKLPASCAAVDLPLRGLLTDLKSRGLLKDTLVNWGGEFGRTPHAEGTDGRDHNVKAFTMWMAGGGVKAGVSHGFSDDYGYEAVDGKVSIHDWHATILHLLGMDHEKLTYRHAGRDFRLTDIHGSVVREIVA